jgi:tetratricopeptide (TPR) repeat protein
LAWPLEPNTDLVLQIHLQPTGKSETIRSEIGFYFTPTAPTNTPFKLALSSLTIDIPPGERSYLVQDSYTLPVDVHVLGVLPHAHYLGKELKGYATLPNGQTSWLLYIKDWNFNWQGDYQYREPVFLPRGTKLTMQYRYDNSSDNPLNPHKPPRRVQYGVQTIDEMGELWLQVLARDKQQLAALSQDYQSKIIEEALLYNSYLLGLDPQNVKAHLALGKAQYFSNKIPEARQSFQTALQLKPDYDEAHYFLGLLARRSNRLADAQNHFAQAVRSNSDHGKAHGNLALLLLEQNELAGAETHFREAIRINPEDVIAHDSLGVIYFQQGDLARAEQHFQLAFKIDPGDADVKKHLELLQRARR